MSVIASRHDLHFRVGQPVELDPVDAVLDKLLAMYPTMADKLSQDTLDGYHAALADCDPDVLMLAALLHIEHSPFFPVVSELLDGVRRLTQRLDFYQAAAQGGTLSWRILVDEWASSPAKLLATRIIESLPALPELTQPATNLVEQPEALRRWDAIWDTTLFELQLQLEDAVFEQLLRGSRVKAEGEDGILVIGVRRKGAEDWLNQRFTGLVERTLARQVGRRVHVRFEWSQA